MIRLEDRLCCFGVIYLVKEPRQMGMGDAYPDLLCQRVSTCFCIAGGRGREMASLPWLRRFRKIERMNEDRMARQLYI